MFLVIACIYDDTNKTIEGYRVVDLNQLQVSELMLQTFKAKTKQYNYLMPNMSFVNASYMEITQNLVSNGATPLSDYPHINKAYTRLTNEAITVAGIIDDINGNPVGVLVFNSLGQMARLSFNDFNKAIVNKTQTNFKLVNNRPYPNNNMQDFPHIRMQQHGVNRAYHSSEGEQAPDISKNNTQTQVATSAQGNTTPKRRGRPPKSATSVPTPPVATSVPTPPVATNVPTPPVVDASVEPPKKKRGRPAKTTTPTVTTPSVTTTEDDVLAPDDIVDNVAEVKPNGPFCPSNNPIKLPEIKITDLDEYVDKELNLSAQQKLMLAGLTFQEMSMYYATVYDAIDKVNDPNLGTFAVSEKQMYYDYAFAAELSVSELVFVLMHEMMHICFMHSVRKGNRDSRLWNIATDLYINTIICQDWGIEFGGPKKVIKEEDMKKKTLEIAIKCPPFGIFLDTIDETLDLTTATAESIYDKLVKENPPQQNQSSNGQGQQSQQGQGQQNQNQQGQGQNQKQDQSQHQNQQGQGQGQGQGQNQDQKQDQNQQGQGQGQGQDQNQQGQQSQDQQGQGQGQQQENSDDANGAGSSGSTNNADGDAKNNKKKSKGNNSNNQDSQDSQDSQDDNAQQNGDGNTEGNMQEVSVVYNGKVIKGTMMTDVCTERNDNDIDSVEKNIADMKQTLSDIDTKLKIAAEKAGMDALTRTYGKGGSLMERHIEFGLSEGIDWRLLLRNICTKNQKGMYVRTKPNRNRINMGMSLPTKQKIGEPTQAGNFVVAIDVSGSISQKKLDYFLGEVARLCKKYEVDGELIYWSTRVGDSGKFSNLQDLQMVKPKSTGGTDVRCVFDYLTGKTKTDTGKKEEMFVRDIKGVFIITDGEFSENYGDYAELFDRRVVWLIDGNPVMFNRLFGRVLGLEYKD